MFRTIIGHSVKVVFRNHISHVCSHTIKVLNLKDENVFYFQLRASYVCIAIVNIVSKD